MLIFLLAFWDEFKLVISDEFIDFLQDHSFCFDNITFHFGTLSVLSAKYNQSIEANLQFLLNINFTFKTLTQG